MKIQKIVPIDNGIVGYYWDKNDQKYQISCKGNSRTSRYTISKYVTDTLVEPIYQTVKTGKYLTKGYEIENSTPKALDVILTKFLTNTNENN